MAQVADKGLLSSVHVFVEVREDREGGGEVLWLVAPEWHGAFRGKVLLPLART